MTEAHAHCWHVKRKPIVGLQMPVDERMFSRADVCCHCGEERLLTSHDAIPRGHGPHCPERETRWVEVQA